MQKTIISNPSSEVVIWCRVSSKEQEDSGYSLPAQEKLLTGYAENRCFPKLKIFSVSESASGKKLRQEFDDMLKYVVKNNIHVIICEKIDRLTRSLKDAVQVNEWIDADVQREVHFVKENCILNKETKSHEKFIWNIKVSVAQYYIDNLSEEVRKGQLGKLEAGWLPTKPPVGYKTVGEQGHKIHIIDETKSALVKQMFTIYSKGNCSLQALTNTIAEEGLTNDNGQKIVKSRIHMLLQDKFYIGINTWHEKEYAGKQATFIDHELFDKVQNVLNRKNAPKRSTHDHLFTGLVKCDECLGQITWEIHKDVDYGHCNHYKDCLQTKWVTEPKIEEQVLQALLPLKINNERVLEWVRKALKESHKDEIEYNTTALEQLNAQFAKIEHRLNQIYTDKLDGEITEAKYRELKTKFESEKQNVLISISGHSKASNSYRELGACLFDLAQGSTSIYTKLKAHKDKKQELLRLVFDILTLNNGELLYTYTRPFQIIYEAVQYTNIHSSKHADIVSNIGNTFELKEKIDQIGKIGDLDVVSPTMLPYSTQNGN